MPWGVAAAAVTAAGSAYAANKKNTSTSTSSESSQTQQATNQALSQAEAIANRGYTPYGGQVVANETPNQQKGTELASSGYAPAQSALSTAATDIGKSASTQYNSQNISQYMDPYVQSVLNPTLNQENINYNQERSALLNSKAGAFGGDRSALEAGQLEYQHGQNVAKDTADVYSQAYTNAQNAFFADQSRQVQAANALAQVGGDIGKLNTDEVQTLMSTGGVGQVLQQAQLNFNYQQFLENRDWSVTNLQPLLSAIDASKGVSRTGTSTPASGSGIGEALGAAATVAGAYFTGGSSLSSSDASNWASGAPADNAVSQDSALTDNVAPITGVDGGP